MKIEEKGKNIELSGVSCLSLKETLDCGQAFRWEPLEDGTWQGMAYNKYLKLCQTQDKIIFFNTTKGDFYNIWYNYFDLDRDYEKIVSTLSEDPILKDAADFGKGIRILKQEPWETLCSFIISQNNNIPRIKGIIGRLCENFGEKSENGFYTFPSAEKIASLSIEELGVIRSGFRAKYISDAAKRVLSGEIDLENLKTLDTDTARNELMKIYGVGKKVADCMLLFGLSHINAFPEDVWIKRAMEKLFGGNLPSCAKGYEGIAQQYIFHYAHTTKLDI